MTTLRMLGNRVLLKPLEAPPRSELIHLTDKPWTFAAEVVSVGRPHCHECGARFISEIRPGDRVYVPATVGHEITMHGETYWVVEYGQLAGRFIDVEEHAHAG